SREMGSSASSHSRDHPTRHHPNAVVAGIGDIDVSRGIDSYSLRVVELCFSGETSVTGKSEIFISSDCVNRPARYLANLAIFIIGNVETAGGVYSQPIRKGQRCPGSRPPVTQETETPISGNRRDRPAGYLPDSIVVCIGDVE